MDYFKHIHHIGLKVAILFFVLPLSSCSDSDAQEADPNPPTETPNAFYLGTDLSYVNELEDFGATYRKNGNLIDPFTLFSEAGSSMVRVRLWHTPPKGYSDFEDVKKTMLRAKAAQMETLLDFHYSDFWADPQKQEIPATWAHITDTEELAETVYNYTYNTLEQFRTAGVVPTMVQIGNEINIEVMQYPGSTPGPINWDRNSTLLQSGLNAVKDFNSNYNTDIQTLLHIAQPENAFWWFEQAYQNGLTAFDIIALSYYPKWSDYSLDQIDTAIASLQTQFGKPVFIVETAYPHSLQNVDNANNILGNDALISGYPATAQGQLDYLIDLTNEVKNANGLGVLYWEPAWVTSNTQTAWGEGSHWDNATFFDAFNNNEALPAFEFFDLSNY
ncbi:arabinogalactan endo-1,4-beta-galactosidase [Urechidicola sp. KH5]